MGIVINTDGISDEQKKTEKFNRAYREMLAQLTQPGFAHVLCCHEAGHLFYLTMAGMKEYDPLPARLEYDPKIDDYGGTLASVAPRDVPHEGNLGEWIWTMARAYAAGGVLSKKLMPSLQDFGDLDDKEQFLKLCQSIKEEVPDFDIDPEALWKQAQDAVLQDFTPALLARIEQFAEEELRPQLGLTESSP